MRWRRRRDADPADPQEPEKPKYTSAHLVAKSKMANATPGETVEARCGAPITRDVFSDDDLPICQACVVAQLDGDDTAADEQARAKLEEGRQAGRTQHASEVAAAGELEARRERERLEAPRFELVGDDAIRFSFEEGTTATVRRDHVGSIVIDQQNGGVHRVVVDGYVLIAHTDEALVRRHHDRLHDVVFGNKVPAAARAS